jgi:hypothetical protein
MQSGQGNVGSGKFTMDGARMSFSIAYKEGILDYAGSVRGDAIELHWTSRADGGSGMALFSFVFVPLTDLFQLKAQ